MEYPLCNSTVTVYRKQGDQVARFVLDRCYYRYETEMLETEEGLRMDRTCLMVVPGNEFIPLVGDRVLDGVGPETVDWDSFLPVFVPGLTELNYSLPQHWLGQHCHTEAGRR